MMDGAQYADDPLDVGWQDGPPAASSLLGVVRRQALPVISCMAASIVLALAIIVYVQPSYTARVSLYLDADGASATEPRGDVAMAVDLDTHAELIRSDETTTKVIQSLGLAAMPEFAPRHSTLNTVIDGLRVWAGVVPAGDAPVDPMPGIVSAVRSGLLVSRNGNTRVLDLRYTSGSAALSVTIADAFATAHLQTIADRDERSRARRIARLDVQTEDMRRKVAASDDRIRAILHRSGMVAADPQELERQSAMLREELSGLEATVAGLSAKLALFDAYARSDDLSAIPIETPESRRLLGELLAARDRLSEIERRTDATSQTVSMTKGAIDALTAGLRQEVRFAARSIEVERDITQARQDNVAGQIARLATYIEGDAWAELTAVGREKAVYEEMYRDYLTQLDAAGRERPNRSELRIVADATAPTRPSSPDAKVVLAIAVTLAAFLGIGFAAIREWNRHDPAQV